MIIIDDDGVMHKVVPISVLEDIKAEIAQVCAYSINLSFASLICSSIVKSSFSSIDLAISMYKTQAILDLLWACVNLETFSIVS